ncbi:hypothetical protein GCM10007967_28500 [Xylanimonas ulmi]
MAIAIDRASARAVAAWACWSIGAVVVASDPSLRDRRRLRAFRLGEPDILVADSRGLIQTRDLPAPELRIALTGRAGTSSVGPLGDHVRLCDIATDPHHEPRPSHPDADAAILFGPNGNDRGVHYTLADLSSLVKHVLGAGDDRRWSALGARLGTVDTAVSLLWPGLMAHPAASSAG